jgi:hypothetical protein
MLNTQQVINRSLECVWMPSGNGLSCVWIEQHDATPAGDRVQDYSRLERTDESDRQKVA